MTEKDLTDQQILIEKTTNGYIIRHPAEGEEYLPQVMVYGDSEDWNVTIVNSLRHIAEWMGCIWSKHNKENLDISFKKSER